MDGTDIWNQIDLTDIEYQNSVAPSLNIDEFNKIAITSHSTRIEGSTLTMSEVLNLIENGTPATGKPILHQNMVLDHYEALIFVLDHAKQKHPITDSFIRTVGAKVMRRTGKTVNSVLGNTDESAGDYRKVNVSAGGHFFVDCSKVVPLIDSFIKNINDKITKASTPEQIYTLAFECHFDLVSIHPFTDGNGRASRLFMNYVEAYHAKPLTVVYSEDKASYYESLALSDKIKSTQPIKEFLAQQHVKFLRQHIEAYKKQTSIDITPKQERGNNIGYSLFF